VNFINLPQDTVKWWILEDSDVSSGPIKGRIFLGQLNYYQPAGKNFAPWS
jgi:hypothetical protein